jgi:hypothetical protein
MSLINLAGTRFGRLTAVEYAGYRAGGGVWACVCDCGAKLECYSANLRRGKSQSCGCFRTEVSTARMLRHGHARRGLVTSEHRIWRGMIERCTNPNSKSHKYYGGRGIRICERWGSFEHFIADMGLRPSPAHSIDRIDVNGNYEPANCRWATAFQQARNKRKKPAA